MTERSTTDNGKALGWCLAIGAILLVIGALSNNGSGSKSSSSSGNSSSATVANVSATAACVHWHNIMGDVQAGILSDSEIREKVKEVRDDAITVGVKNAATDLLAAVTSGNRSQVKTATVGMMLACS